MKAKILIGLIIVLGVFVIKSMQAPFASAQNPTIKVQGIFVNGGVIPVNVWYYYSYTNTTGGLVQFYPTSGTQPIYVSAGTTGYGTNATVPDLPGQVNQPLTVTWGSDCFDPTVAANYAGVTTDAFNFTATVDVTCPAAPSGLIGSCDAANNLSFSWNNTVHTQFDVNVNDTIDGEGGPTDTYHLKTAANSYSRSGQAGRTYTWWVHTLYNSIWSVATNGNTISCAAPITPPPEPTRNNPPTQSCNGTNVNATFSWNAVSGAPAVYRLDIWDPSGVWTANSHEGGGTTGWAYQDTGGSTSWTWNSFPSNSGQTWTARAFRDGLWSDIATWSGFTTINCNTVVQPTNLTANPSCPLVTLQVQFNWVDNATNETAYYLEVSTSSGFGTLATKNLGVNASSFWWSSAGPMTSGTPLTPAYSTTYYSRVRAYNSNTGIYSTYSTTTSFTTQASGSCTPPAVVLTVFPDPNSSGVQDAGENFNNGTFPNFSASVATVNEFSAATGTDITTSISPGGTRTAPVTAGNLTYYKVTVASGWVITSYTSDLSLAAPACPDALPNPPCAYSAGSPPATGQWLAAVNGVWNLKLGVRATTSTMNATIFYDKDSDGVFDAGETFGGTNPNFSASVAQLIENGNGSIMADRTTSFSAAGAYTTPVNANYFRQFQVNPAVGWVVTTWRSDKTVGTCTANTSCAYNQSWTQSYTTPGGETFNFWLGINTAVPANPGAGPPGTGDCTATVLSVTLTWKDNATFETGYFLEVYSNSSYSTLVGTKTFAANVSSFTWKNPGTASEKLDNAAAPAYGANYYWRIQARNNSSTSAWVYPNSNGTGQLAPSTNPASMPALSACTPPADPTSLAVSSSCSSGILTVNFSFTDNATNESGYIIDVSTGGNATTWASTWGGKYLNTDQSSFAWKNTATESDLLSFPDSDPNTTGNQIAPSFGTTYRWRVVAYNIRDIQSNHKYPANTTSPTGTSFATPTSTSCSPAANPSSPTVTITCPSGLPALQFSWTDNATNDTEYYVDINGAAWTGASSPSPWGVKTLAGNGATTGAASWTWSSTAPVDTGGDTDPVTVGNQLTPQANKTYWWRVIARNNSTSPALFSSHVYPNGGTGTTVWPGTQVTPSCSPNLVVSAFTIPGGDIGSAQNASVTVANSGLVTTGTGFNVGVVMNASSLSCGGASFTASTTALAAGSSAIVTVPVTLPSAVGTLTATAMADSGPSSCPGGAVTESNEADNTLTTTYTVQGFDLSVSITSFNKTPATYDANEIATATITVTNSASANKIAPAGLTVGFWPYIPYSGNAFPDCSTGTPGVAPTVGSNNLNITIPDNIPAGTTRTVNALFDVGAVPATFTSHAYVIPSCNPVDYNWTNNSTANTGSGRTYSVIVKSWFEGSGGGVGSQGAVSVSQIPPASGKQSNYLVAGANVSINVNSGWKITGYTQRQVPTIVYPYLKEVFYETAKVKPSVCNFSTYSAGANYCNTNAIFDTGAFSTVPVNGTYYWFVDGNLNINTNIVLPSATALVFIVRGDVFVKTSVTRVDGIYVAGQTFRAQTSDTDFIGAQLVINGAVYTNQTDIKRLLGGGAGVCGSICNNATDPAIKFNYDPKYLILLSSLGTPSLSWNEVAP